MARKCCQFNDKIIFVQLCNRKAWDKIMERKIVICDDNLIEAKKAQDTIERFEQSVGESCSITVYTDGRKFVDDCKKGNINPNMVFMDVELEDGNGIEVAKEINKILPKCQIVYLSNYLKYATDTYQTNHIYYVIKPELEKRLSEIHKKISKNEKEETKVLMLKLRKNRYEAIKKKDILYIERKGRVSYIHTKTENYETNLTLNELYDMLKEVYFIRCHNSYIVSMKHIASYKREMIKMENEDEIPVSRKYQKDVKEEFVKWVQAEVF